MTWLEPVLGPWQSTVDGSDLRRAAEHELKQETERAGLEGTFGRATIYVAVDPDTDQIVRHTRAGSTWVHAYSAYELLPEARSGNDEVWHRRLNGAALRNQLPDDVGIELDHGLLHARAIVRPKARLIAPEDVQG